MPTLRQLSYLVAIADCRHFGRAAAQAGVSQPTLSHQIRALESRLGCALVERGESPARLTPVGREIAERARRILLDVEDLRGLARRSREAMAGTIRFGVTPTIGPYLMPPVIAHLHRTHPDMRLYMREGFPDEQLGQLRKGELDMMLIPLPVRGEDLAIEPLFREPLHIVAPPEHPLCRKSTLTGDDLLGASILTLDPRHPLHRQTAGICEKYGANLMRDYEGTSLDSLRQMAGSGIGLAILPELYLRSDVGGEDLVRRLVLGGWAEGRSVAAVWRRGAAFGESYAVIAAAIAEEARAQLGLGVTPGR